MSALAGSSQDEIYSPVLLGSSSHHTLATSGDEAEVASVREQGFPVELRDSSVVRVLRSQRPKFFNTTLLVRFTMGLGLISVIVIGVLLTKPDSNKSGSKGDSVGSSPKRTYLSSEQEADAVEYLPGWSPLPIPSQQFSGFVDADAEGTLKMHYQFVEAETNPSEAPLLLFYNGGPGASSLYGLYVELGPFLLSDSSLEGAEYAKTGIPQLLYNEYGWQKVANLLVFSMPPPIGYSYCLPKGPSATGNDCGPWNDTSTAQVSYHALTSWLTRFPQYANHKVWLSGESYAGVYVPEIVKQIMAHQPDNGINLAGFLVGDACTPPAICGGDKVGPYWSIEFLYGKGAFSNKLYAQIQSSCTQDELLHGVTPNTPCSDAVGKVSAEAGGYWLYGFYDDCWYQNDIRRQRDRRALSMISGQPYSRNTPGYYEYFGPPMHSASSMQQRRASSVGTSSNTGAKMGKTSVGQIVQDAMGFPADRVVDFPNGYQCGGPAAQVEWLGLSVVKKALNIPSDAIFFQSDNGVGFTYLFGENNLVSWYNEVIAQNKLRIVVYNGDTDPCINSLQSQDWTSKLGFAETQSWRPWTIDGCQRMGGYVTRYENNFDFLTIRGSGHMVPQDKPKATLAFLSAVLQGDDYPKYDSSCTSPP